MGKEIILLAQSKKYNNLCIAGIDTSTGDWIRIVSQDSGVSHAVKVEDAIYEDGSVPELLDIVEIECNGCQFNYYQLENYVYDPGYYWSKIETKFRQPDRLSNPAQVLKLLVPAYQKVSGARAVSKHLKLNENESHSFAVFLTGLQKVIAD